MQAKPISGAGSSASYTASWLGLWQCAALLNGAALESVALFWDMRPTRGDSLASLSRTLDTCMRSPAFLRLIEAGLKVLNGSFGVGPRASRFSRSVSP
jgi:hypothetical protein